MFGIQVYTAGSCKMLYMNVVAEAKRVYTESPSSDCPNTCTTGKQCVCDVILKTHSCQDDGKSY